MKSAKLRHTLRRHAKRLRALCDEVSPRFDPEVKAWSREYLSTLKSRWQVSYDPRIIHLQASGAINGKHKKADRKRLDAFLHRELEGVRHLFQQRPMQDDAIHEARKALKDMLYTTGWFTGKKPKDLSRAAGIAGRFVDKRTGISLINRYIKEAAGTPGILLLKDKWERAKFKSKRQVIKDLDRLLH